MPRVWERAASAHSTPHCKPLEEMPGPPISSDEPLEFFKEDNEMMLLVKPEIIVPLESKEKHDKQKAVQEANREMFERNSFAAEWMREKALQESNVFRARRCKESSTSPRT